MDLFNWDNIVLQVIKLHVSKITDKYATLLDLKVGAILLIARKVALHKISKAAM
jgi:hypothetical protein